jgi:hypothetical protein
MRTAAPATELLDPVAGELAAESSGRWLARPRRRCPLHAGRRRLARRRIGRLK